MEERGSRRKGARTLPGGARIGVGVEAESAICAARSALITATMRLEVLSHRDDAEKIAPGGEEGETVAQGGRHRNETSDNPR